MKTYQSSKIVKAAKLKLIHRRVKSGSETELVLTDVEDVTYVIDEEFAMNKMRLMSEQLVRLDDLSTQMDAQGYLVKYRDGYLSWSPEAVFESGNRELKPYYGIGVQCIEETGFEAGVQNLTVKLMDGRIFKQRRYWASHKSGSVFEAYQQLLTMDINNDDLLRLMLKMSTFFGGDNFELLLEAESKQAGKVVL